MAQDMKVLVMHDNQDVLRDISVILSFLDEDVVFYSPVVHTPQKGKEITKLYLTAAGGVFNTKASGQMSDNSRPSSSEFRYIKEVIGKRDEVKNVLGMYIMNTKKGTLFLADTTINVNPTEDEIVEAMKLIWKRMKIVIEPSSAVPLATILKNPEVFKGKRVGVIITGGNVDLDKLPWMNK